MTLQLPGCLYVEEGGVMDSSMIEQRVHDEVEHVRDLLPHADFQQPGHAPLSIDEIAGKLAAEYGDALELLGKL